MNIAPLIIDTGGTFNKRYQRVSGSLDIDPETTAVERIIQSAKANLDAQIIAPLRKDSLDFTAQDRDLICRLVQTMAQQAVLIIHGTDTMDQTAQALAQFLSQHDLSRQIVLTGSMVPFSIDPIEPALNVGLALGFLQNNPSNGVYLAMNGLIAPYTDLVKDRSRGVFLTR